ncbi:MAG: hypothetical protein ACR2M5_02820 [Nakamurella sp.]
MLTEVGESLEPTVPAVRSGFRRVAGISASLVGTQALTSILGLAFWTLAARNFAATDVGVAGAAIAMMMLLGSLGSLGLGTLLIARLPLTDQGDRRVLVRTCLLVAGGTSACLAVAVPEVAVHVFGADNLLPLVATPLTVAAFAVGTGLMAVVMVLDQAVLTLGVGILQFERNVLASIVKIAVLVGFGASGLSGGMTIFIAWAIGTLISLPVVSWRTRGGRVLQANRRIVDRRALTGLGRMAASHHALNTTLQAALQILPVMVTVLISARENAYFNTAVMLSGFVFALPYAIAIGLFASSSGSEREVLSRIRLTLPFSLGVSVLANLLMYPLAGFVLGLFGQSYASAGVGILRALVLAGIPFVIKDHYIALRRVQGRTAEAVALMTGFLVVELAAAAIGAKLAGTIGLCLAWVGVLAVEAAVLSVPLYRSWRQFRRDDAVPANAAIGGADPAVLVVHAARLADQPAADSVSQSDIENESKTVSVTTVARRRLLGSANLAGPTMVLMAVGVLLMAVAANAGRAGTATGAASATWVAGLVLIFLPACFRVVVRSTGHAERMILAVALPVILQFSRLVLNPTQFAFHDELIHANTLRQIDESSRLFTDNSLLPVSGYYPGLEVVTDAIHSVTGLSMFVSAAIALMMARVVISLAIIALVTLVTGSRRAGAIGAVIYVLNPQELFFNSQYSYQTLALPLAVFAVYLFAVRRRGSRTALVLPLAAVAMVTFTHHLTAVLLVVGFAGWFLVDVCLTGRRRKRRAEVTATGRSAEVTADDFPLEIRRDRGGLAWMTVGGIGMTLLAALNPGSPVGGYLQSIVGSSTADVTSLTEGKKTKALFADTAGTGPAWWEQLLLLAAVVLTMASMLIVLRFLWIRMRRGRPLAVVVGLLALLYPVIPAGHLTAATAEVGDRASGFVFVGIAAVLGWWLSRSRWRTWSTMAFVAAALVTFLGNIVLGAGPTAGQLPGPYEISADARSVDAANLSAARWLASGIPPDSTVYGDRTSGLLAAADGGQDTVLHVSTNLDVSRLLLDPQFTAKDVSLIKQAHIAYLIVDTRLSEGLPHQQFYVESGEFGANDRSGPVPAAALAKFASVPGVQRIYDNGSLVVYDVRGLRG